MSSTDILQIPEIQPFQFNNDNSGIDNTVNLFRGDVNFYIPLVSLMGRNGLDLQVSALYKSNVSQQAETRNLTSPTSILGLGWDLPTDRIEVETKGTAGRENNSYFFVRSGSRNLLYRNDKTWLRGTINSSYSTELDALNFSQALSGAILAQGIRIDSSSTIIQINPGEKWQITDPSNEFELLLIQEDNHIVIQDAGQSYELQGFDFSRIRYYPNFEKWEITYSNGISNVLGGNVISSNNNQTTQQHSIQWAVRTGNWEGSSSLTHVGQQRIQSQYAKVWHFAYSKTLWNDRITFEYEQEVQAVGSQGLNYTKAIYLKKITDVFGRTVVFNYKDKTYDDSSPKSPREYADPHKAKPNKEADAFQSKYQTQYLNEIQVFNEHNELLFDLSFEYQLQRFTQAPSNNNFLYGDTFKRTLTSIHKTAGTGHAYPNINMTYYPATNNNSGAIKSITYAEGSTVTYSYAKNELKNCARDLTVNAPSPSSTPRVWFGDDYAVVTWYSQGKLDFAIYTWVGRWQIWRPKVSTFNDTINPDEISCDIQNDFIVLHYENANGQNTTIRAFHKNPQIIGAWLEYDKNPIIINSQKASVTSGEKFFTVADNDTNHVNTYTWDGLTFNWDKQALIGYVPPSQPGNTALFMAGSENILLFLSYDKNGAPGSKDNQLYLYYLDELGTWHLGDQRKATEISIEQNNLSTNFSWSPLPWSMTASYVTSEDQSTLNYQLSIYQWDTSYRFTSPVNKPFSLTKSNPSGSVTIPYVANCTDDGLISSGPNLLRFNGEEWLENNNLDIVQPVLDGTIFWFAVGPDYVIKTENSENRIITEVQVFDPNTQSTAWQESNIPLFDSQPVGNRMTGYFPSAAPDFITWNTNIYERGSSNDWIKPLKSPTGSIPTGSDTTTLFNQGPQFMAYLLKSSDGKNVLGTEIITLINGQVESTTRINQRYFSLVNEDGNFVADVNGKMPGGPESFLTYLPMDKAFDEASSITLYRYLGQSIEAPVVNYPANKVTVDDGFQTSDTFYGFDADTATCDYQGTTAKYFKTTVRKVSSNSHGYSVYHFFNSLDGVAANKENLSVSSFLDGLLSEKNDYDANDKLVASVKTTSQVINHIALTPGGQANAPIYGAIVQATESTHMKDGVSTTTHYEYNPASGGVTQQSMTSYNALGEKEVHMTSKLYGFETYEQLWYVNKLAAVSQSKAFNTIDGGIQTVVSSMATTFKSFASPVSATQQLMIFETFEKYQWLGGDRSSDFDFAKWSSGSGYPDDWYKNASIQLRSEYGQIEDSQAPIGQQDSNLFSTDGSLQVATVSNASFQAQEAYYYGFENYENPSIWQLTHNTPIADDISYSGSHCLKIPGNEKSTELVLTPGDQKCDYLFSFWAKAAAGHDTKAPAGWLVSFYDGKKLLSSQFIEIGANESWEYHFKSISLIHSGVAKVSVHFQAQNKDAVDVYFDNIGFSPLNNPLHVTVYDEVYYHATEEIGPYNNTLRRRYDSLGRIIAQTDDTDGLVRIAAPFLSRQVNGEFQTSEPNTVNNFQPMGTTLIDRFFNAGNYSDHWTAATNNDWISQKGYLMHTSKQASSIALTQPSFTDNYVAHVGFSATESIQHELGIKVANELTIQWQPSTKKWQLIDHKNNQKMDSPFNNTNPGEDWTLALSKELIIFMVDGRLVFSYQPKKMVSGDFSLFSSDVVAFNNFFIGTKPQIASKFLTGSGKTLQGQSIEGSHVTVTQNVYDELGRQAITTKPANLPTTNVPALKYRADAVTHVDWSTGVIQGEIASQLPDDEGYPYSRKTYENSPLSRPLQIGAPGKKFAITGGNNDHIVNYSYSCNSDEFNELPASQYFKTTRTDQNGHMKFSLSDKFGNQVTNAMVDDHQTITKRSVTLLNYDKIGSTKTERLPNYFNPPKHSNAADWQRSTVFDMRGRMVSFTEPNSGTTFYIYDSNGLVRFSQNPEQAKLGQILYKKYDTDNRVVEEGSFPYKWNTQTLQNQADDDPNWPGQTQSTQVKNNYQYNGDDNQINNLGQLTEITTFNQSNGRSDQIVTIKHAYNDRQKLAQTQVKMNDDNITFSSAYAYDNLGNIAQTTYPSGVILNNQRDEVGRVKAVSDQQNNSLLEIEYNAGDQVLSETNKFIANSPTTTHYSYNSPGWLTQTSSPVMNETLHYTEGGFQSAAYYDGNIAAKTTRLTVPNGSQLPANLNYKYQYDAAYQVEVAECSVGNQVMDQWSLGVKKAISYDDNGNFIEVDAEQYEYQARTDFAINTSGNTTQSFAQDLDGNTVKALPRGISQIIRDIYTGRPNTIDTNTQGSLSFLYDDKNNRLAKKNDSNNNKFYGRNANGVVLTEQTSKAGTPETHDYYYGPNGVFGVNNGGKQQAIHKDHLKSPRVLVNDQGEVATAFQYQPFGSLIEAAQSNTELLDYLFGGYEFDQETGLLNAGARLYDPELRRFYGVDPKLQYASPFLFAGNNPINQIDPNGEAAWWAMLIGAVVGAIVTVATGGAGAVLFGTELAASAAVGAVAGTAGALAGDATTAGIAGEKFTGQRALVDALSGFAGGLVGAGVGGLAGKGAMNAAFNAGKNTAADVAFVSRLGTSTSMLTGGIAGATASAGVTSAMTGQPFFSKETALNIAIGAVAGAGGALMASGAHFGWFGAMPVELGANDFNRINANLDIGSNGQKLLTMVSPNEYTNTKAQIRALNLGGDDAIFRMTPAGNPDADVIALHGIGRYVFPYTTEGYTRPMSARMFADYLQTNHPHFNANAYAPHNVPPLKLSICFSALPGRFGSVGQTLASSLGRETFTGRGIVYPTNLAQNWVRFTP